MVAVQIAVWLSVQGALSLHLRHRLNPSSLAPRGLVVSTLQGHSTKSQGPGLRETNSDY